MKAHTIVTVMVLLVSVYCHGVSFGAELKQKQWAKDVEDGWAPGLVQCMRKFDEYMAGKSHSATDPNECYEKAQAYWQKRFEKASRQADIMCTRICTGGNTLSEDFDDCLALRKELKNATETSMELFEQYAARIWGVHEPSGGSRYEFQLKVKMLALRSMTLMYEAIFAHRNAYVDDKELDANTKDLMDELKNESFNKDQKRRQDMENSFK